MNKSVCGLIFSLVITLNTASFIFAGEKGDDEDNLPTDLPKFDGRPKHRRTLSVDDENLKSFMATGKQGKNGKRDTRYGRSLPGSRQYDPSELEELLKELAKRNGSDSELGETVDKREFRGRDFAKWKAGQEKWLERQEKRADEKRYIEQIAGKGADEGDANLILISAFNHNEPILSFAEYLRDEGEKAAVRLLGKDLCNEISRDTDRLEK